MEYVEKSKWASGAKLTHEYKNLDEALKDMERNEGFEIISQ